MNPSAMAAVPAMAPAASRAIQFTTAVLTDLASMDQIHREWMALYRSSGHCIFQNPDWHRIWWNRLASREGRTPHLVIGRTGHRITAVAPLAVSRRNGLRILEWAGIKAFDYPDVLLAPEANRVAFWSAIRKSPHYDIAHLRYVRNDTASAPALGQFAYPAGSDETVYAIHRAHESGQAWLDTLPRSARREHREKIRILERTGPLTLRIASSPADIGVMVDALVKYKVSWANERNLPTPFAAPGMQEYFQALALSALEDGILHLSSLMCGDRNLSTHLGFVSSDGFYYYVSAYDTACSQLSPGRLHMNLLVMWAFDHGLQRFDFLRGEGDYKTRLGTPARLLKHYIFARGAVGLTALHAHLWREWWKSARTQASGVSEPGLAWARSLLPFRERRAATVASDHKVFKPTDGDQKIPARDLLPAAQQP